MNQRRQFFAIVLAVAIWTGCDQEPMAPKAETLTTSLRLAGVAVDPPQIIQGPGGPFREARDLNNAGQVALWEGWSWNNEGGAFNLGLSRGWAINELGWVAGNASLEGLSGARPAIWTPEGGLQILYTNHSGLVHDINDAGHAVGSVVIGGWAQGFRWTPASDFQFISTPSSWQYFQPEGVNNLDQVVGHYATMSSPFSPVPVLWTQEGGFLTLPMPTGATGLALDINDQSQIVGSVAGAPALWTEATASAMSPSGYFGSAQAINENGIVAGTSSAGRAFVWSVSSDPNELPLPDGYSRSAARGINDTGSIVGNIEAISPLAALWRYEVWEFVGFFAPVDNPPAVNIVNGGRAVPVKFSIGGDKGLDIFAPGYPASGRYACDTQAPETGLEISETVGKGGLQYDASNDIYTYVWSTKKAWAGSCRELVFNLRDGTSHVLQFRIR